MLRLNDAAVGELALTEHKVRAIVDGLRQHRAYVVQAKPSGKIAKPSLNGPCLMRAKRMTKAVASAHDV